MLTTATAAVIALVAAFKVLKEAIPAIGGILKDMGSGIADAFGRIKSDISSALNGIPSLILKAFAADQAGLAMKLFWDALKLAFKIGA